MPRVPVREAVAEKEERDGDLCQSCSAAAVGSGPHCEQCASYWSDVDQGLFDDWEWI